LFLAVYYLQWTTFIYPASTEAPYTTPSQGGTNMKKRRLALILVFVSAMLSVDTAAHSQERSMEWQVKPIRIEVHTSEGVEIRYDYCLAYGNEEIFATDRKLAKRDCNRVAMIYQPVEEVEMPFEAIHGWYAQLYDMYFGWSEIKDLYNPEVYALVPDVIKLAMDRLGALEDPDLILIIYNTFTESVRMYYHPKFNEDLEFYESKLQALCK
jgi:hypothetical protein